MIDKNIPRSAFSERTWASGFRPRVGDYFSWPCEQFDNSGNWCYNPIEILSLEGGRFHTEHHGTIGLVDEWHINYFIWYRPAKKLTILIKNYD